MNSISTRAHDRLGLRTSPIIFFGSAFLIVLFTAGMGLFPGPVQKFFGSIAHWLRYDIGWFYTAGATLLVVFSVGLAMSRYGRIKIGADDAEPEYSGLAWFGMMFAAGVGAVLMFWGIAEPMNHYANPPMGDKAFTDAAAWQAINIANFHFGIHMWAVLIVPGLSFGYFTYKRNLPPRVSSAFHPVLGDRIHGPIGRTIDIISIVATVFGLAVSTGLGALQINSGMKYVFGVPISGMVQAAILAVITAAALTSVLAGMDKGVKRLSYANIILAIALMLFILMNAASTSDLMRSIIEASGRYLSALPVLSTFNDSFGHGQWSGDWTVFYWAWTVTWAPFVGMFVAKISRGRSIRAFVAASLGLPTAFVVVWMSIYGFSAITSDRASADKPGTGGELTKTIVDDGRVQDALFQFLKDMPLYGVTATLALIVIVVFFVTSIDSGALVLDAMANGHEDMGTRRQRVFWSLSVGAVCAAIILTAGDNGLNALQEVIIVIGFPVMILTILQAFLLLQALREDAGAAKPIRTRQWKKVLPQEEYERRAAENSEDMDEYVVLPEFEIGTEPEYETHTPTTSHTQALAARRAAVSIGLTGAVASGKSVVADEFERRGAVVVEFDELMREVLTPGHETLEDLRAVFSEEIVHPDGTIDWETLDGLTTESHSARRRLYDVVGPAVREVADARAKAVGEDSVLVLDLALLTESTPRDFDQVVVVSAPVELRVGRLMEERGLTREQAWAEIDADTQQSEREDAADFVMENAGTRDELRELVDAHWDEHVQPVLDATSAHAGS
ncbi:dephospho-CoA kinase [Dermacoccus sp. Tok2021]|uniref:dephospho-CoA kinase n=1 Tax=Dermacoccus sp. Tok2021 TaxID=2826873 RepID=UPI001CA65E93|nr:dephospho-CoA kinase [Dermacoccus sp. Tok2021]